MTRWIPLLLTGLAWPVTARAQESVFNLPAFAVPEEGATIRTRALGGAGSGVGGSPIPRRSRDSAAPACTSP